MSCKANVDVLTWEMRQKIDVDLKIKLEDTKYSMGPPRYFYPHSMEGNSVLLPFAYAYRELKLKRPSREQFSEMKVKFEGTLREEQVEIKKEAMECLNKKGSVVISCYTGFGKSITAVSLACSIGFKTLIIVNKLVLMKQWEESVKLFCPAARFQKLTAQSTMEDVDFYIMNAQNVEKMGRTFFKNIGLVVVDEAHLIMAETLSHSLQYISPRYMIGLTATPYRPDGLDVLLELYFGKHKIIRELNRKHLVYKVETGFVPKVEMAANGRLNWGVVLDSQAKDLERNELIIRIVKNYPNRNFLILTKRVDQGNFLEKRLREEGQYVTSMIGSNQVYDKNARVLVGTTSKLGTGFDHPKLDTLILAADLQEYFIQYLGRIMRTKEGEPLVFDLLDDHPILKRHYMTRNAVYKKHGGTVRRFDIASLK